MDTNTTNRVCVLWRSTDGLISIWFVDTDLSVITTKAYGPYFGYDLTPGLAVRKPAQRSQTGSQEADIKAAAAMKAVGSGAGTPMPKQ